METHTKQKPNKQKKTKERIKRQKRSGKGKAPRRLESGPLKVLECRAEGGNMGCLLLGKGQLRGEVVWEEGAAKGGSAVGGGKAIPLKEKVSWLQGTFIKREMQSGGRTGRRLSATLEKN